MSNLQARLIAVSLALIAGAILCATRPDDPSQRSTVLVIAAVLFVVEYIRAQLPAGDVRPPAA